MSPALILTSNIDDADGFYADLLEAHEALKNEESEALNARLILIMANHIGNRSILMQALEAASMTRNNT